MPQEGLIKPPNIAEKKTTEVAIRRPKETSMANLIWCTLISTWENDNRRKDRSNSMLYGQFYKV